MTYVRAATDCGYPPVVSGQEVLVCMFGGACCAFLSAQPLRFLVECLLVRTSLIIAEFFVHDPADLRLLGARRSSSVVPALLVGCGRLVVAGGDPDVKGGFAVCVQHFAGHNTFYPDLIVQSRHRCDPPAVEGFVSGLTLPLRVTGVLTQPVWIRPVGISRTWVVAGTG